LIKLILKDLFFIQYVESVLKISFFLKLKENVEQKYVQFNIFKPVAEN